jgi:hypothetical protein
MDTADHYFEIATACRLSAWLGTRRSDVGVYSVEPRIAGDVRAWRQSFAADMQSNVRGVPVSAAVDSTEAGADLAATIVGFGAITRLTDPGPTRDDGADEPPALNNPNEARFGWLVRPRRIPGRGWAPVNQRLAAVLSIPSWWSEAQFVVSACWLAPDALAASLRGDEGRIMANNLARLCDDRPGHFQREFLVRLPRRVDEIVDRFNFDFIKAPYFNSAVHGIDGQPLALDVGRQGALALSGTRLWRGTVVVLGGQVADRIVVLPDMEGVIAEFDCVRPNPVGNGDSRSASVQVWTAEGVTASLPVRMNPFRGEKPCYEEKPEQP